jgi:Protein of unknown function (DUF4238)
MESQYQHFIPQFILRKFSNFEQLRAEGESSKKARKYCKVSFLSLENGTFETRPACRTFGVQNMYQDIDQASITRFEVEEKLRLLEQQAAKILDNVENAYKRGDAVITISRQDKDELRRFLFIMLYRNRTLEYRYEKSKQNYHADDRALMMKYMEEKRFEDPKTVWLANICAFLEVTLGHDSDRWIREIFQKAYPLDAQWFVGHMTTTFLSFCCPTADSFDEFVLTQNAYSIFERPSEENQWTDWHVFAPISPHLTITMRKNMLQKCGLPELENDRQKFLKLMLSTCFDNPSDAQSSLIDLPLERPQTSYSEHFRNRQQLSNNDTFTFKFIQLCPDHLQRINSIFLEEALEIAGVVFRSRESFKRALEAYFVLDPIRFKQVSSNLGMSKRGSAGLAFGKEKNDWIRANRENYLKLLEEAASHLGSSVKPRYFDRNTKFFQWLESMPPSFLRRYHTLGWSFILEVVDAD